MTINRSTLLDLPLPVTGTEAGTWGDVTNNGLTNYLDIAIAGMNSLTSSDFTAGALTIALTEGDSSATNIAAGTAQYATIKVSSLAQASTITAPASARSYKIINADATYNLTIKASGQTGVTFLPGTTGLVAFNGTDYEIVGVVGPASATDNAVARFDSTTGQVIQNSVVTIADSTGDISGVGTLNATTADLTNIEVTNIKAKDGTAAGSIADSTGVVTLASSVLTTTDINGGTIDNTAIGGSTASTGAFTTLSASSTATFAAGAVGTPSITTVGDTNTGIYFPAADTIGFVEGGSEAMRIDNAGNVGIGGTTNLTGSRLYVQQTGELYSGGGSSYNSLFPSGYIQVLEARNVPSGTVNSSLLVFSNTNSNGNTQAYIGSQSGNSDNAPANLVFGQKTSSTVWTERMRIDSSGNVGIGTSSPASKLSVYGTSGNSAISFFGSGGSAVGYMGSTAAGNYIVGAVANETFIRSDGVGIAFSANTGSSVQMRLDSSGNLGLGVTPSAWGSSYKTIQVGNGSFSTYGSTSNTSLYANAYRNSSDNPIYINSSYATQYQMASGQHIWYTAPSGTAGNAITFTQAMTLDASGNLGIGTTSPSYRLSVRQPTLTATLAEFRTIDGTNNPGLEIRTSTAGTTLAQVYSSGATANLIFETNSSEAARIDSSGNLLVGTTSNANGARLNVRYSSGGTDPTGVVNIVCGDNATFNSGLLAVKNAGNRGNIGNASGSPLFNFEFNDAPGMSMDKSGNLLVGTTTQLGSARATFKAGSTLPGISIGMANSTGTYAAQIFFDGDNTDSGSIDVNNDANTTAYTTSSDYRLKTNVQPITDAVDKLKLLNPVTWNWKKNPSLSSSGFIAHELQDICPDAVTGVKDEVDDNGNPIYQGVDTSFLVATLTAAIQEQQAIIESLKSRLDAAGL